MEALLWEVLSQGSADDIVEVLIKLTDSESVPENATIVAKIGNVVSCRIRRGDIEQIRGDNRVASMKASRLLQIEPSFEESHNIHWGGSEALEGNSRPSISSLTGEGVIIGIADWGFDFTHPNFIDEDGSSRFIGIWDQGADYDMQNPYGYGAIYYKCDIDSALKSDRPFDFLGYHPGKSDIFHHGMHGTHVLDIAAGNGAAGNPGIAPNAGLLAVHLSTGQFKDLMGLGDSARLFDAIHFLDQTAGDTPLVINMSVGNHGDSHTGLSLIEQTIDFLVTSKPDRAVVQSCGNYFDAQTHFSGRLKKGETVEIEWLIDNRDKTPNEIEIWFSSDDAISISLISPQNETVLEGESVGRKTIYSDTEIKIGNYYQRKNEPNTNLSTILIILNEHSETGKWKVQLFGNAITDGRIEAWIERDVRGDFNQSRFPLDYSNKNMTTGSICNSLHTISVGAYDIKNAMIGPFSSSGPTWDGRQVPFLLAPGIGISAAKSSLPFQERSKGEVAIKTGTSMAAPYVAGAIALIYEEFDSPLSIHEVKRRLLKGCETPIMRSQSEIQRSGNGVLNIELLFPGVKKKQKMPYNMEHKTLYPQNMPAEVLLDYYQEAIPELNTGNLVDFYESLPNARTLLEELNLQKGDILIRRQYAHSEPAWLGVVDVIENENEVHVITNRGRKKISLSKDGQRLDWELKKVPSAYIEQFNEYYNNLSEDNPPTGTIKVGYEIDLKEYKTKKSTKYGDWEISATLKLAPSLSGSSGTPFGSQTAVTSKKKEGEGVIGIKQEYAYSGLQDALKGFNIENLDISLGGEWSGLEISAYANAKFNFTSRSIGKIPAAIKLEIIKFKEGDSLPSIGAIEGYFDSPAFEIGPDGEKVKVFIRYKIKWNLSKEKVAKEIVEKLVKAKLKSEAKKQGFKVFTRVVAEATIKKLGPLVTAFGIGWDIGTVLNAITISDEVALETHEAILGDLNERYQQADTLGKIWLIFSNKERIILSLAAAGFTGTVTGISDLVLFKIMGLDQLASSFNKAIVTFTEILALIHNVGDAFGDSILSGIYKLGIKTNPKYFRTTYPDIQVFVTAIYHTIKPLYKKTGGFDDFIKLKIYDIIVDDQIDYHARMVDFIIKNKLEYGSIGLGKSRDEIFTLFLDYAPQDFLMLLEKYKLISYTVPISGDLSTSAISQDLIDELFL